MKVNKTTHRASFTPFNFGIEVETEKERELLAHLFGCWNDSNGCNCREEVVVLALHLNDMLRKGDYETK